MGKVDASKMTGLSIIIPVYNEEAYIHKLLDHLLYSAKMSSNLEIIVVDYANSTKVKNSKVIHVNSPLKGKAEQMNFGAAIAKCEILYFLHADTYPPQNFDQLIFSEISRGNTSGCFRMEFDKDHYFLRFFAWFTRFNSNWCRGGDQSLFVKRSLFESIDGFDTSHLLMEDLEIVKRLKEAGKFVVIKDGAVVTSSRKYEKNGIFKLQFLFSFLHLQYRLGCSQSKMVRFYNRFIMTP